VIRDLIDRSAATPRSGGATALSAIARARRDPRFYIVDGDLRLLSASAGLLDSELNCLPADVYAVAQRLLARSRTESANLTAPLGNDAIVRLVPAAGPGKMYVIFVSEARNPIALATKRYGFTIRESEVLEHVVRGKSTGDIAGVLTISELTVLQHVRNIGKKVGVSKRKEIVAALAGA
jgi:DNA-binding CsgD family transcriptional regulator